MQLDQILFGFIELRSQAIQLLVQTFRGGGEFLIGNLLETGIDHQHPRGRPDFLRCRIRTVVDGANPIRDDLSTAEIEG